MAQDEQQPGSAEHARFNAAEQRSKFGRGSAGGLIALYEQTPYDRRQTPVINWIPSSADLVGKDQATEVLRQAGLDVDNLAAFDNGLQATFLARRGDVLILQNDPENQQAVETAVRRTSELWERQTGISPITPETGSVVLTDSMLSEVPRRSRLHTDAGLRIPQVIDQVMEVTRGLDRRFADYWNDKNLALPHLDAHGVPVAATSVFNEFDPAVLERSLQEQHAGKRLVVKIAGAAGGIGVHTNDGRGYTHEEAMQVARGIPGRFQVQEFIPGSDYGVVGYIDADGQTSIVSQHKQRVHNGEFFGAIVTPDIMTDDSISNAALQAFGVQHRHAQEVGVAIIGPSGVDIRKGNTGGPKIIETNMRETGAISAALIREQAATNPGFRANVEQALRGPIERISTNTGIAVPPEVFTEADFVDAVIKLGRENGVVILTNGFNVHPLNSDTKMIFLNDKEQKGSTFGKTEQAFMQLVDDMYEQRAGQQGPNRHKYQVAGSH